MDVRRLGHFVAVADHGGFTAAAKAVHVSQPALSLAVKDLENELGTRLFTRAGRKAQLTAAGQALLGPARQVLRDLQTGRAAVAAVTGLESGNLTLASLPTLAADPVAGLVGEFRRQYPGIRIDLAAPDDSTDLLDLVITGACELGVTEARDVPGTLEAISLGAQELALILPPGTATADRESGQLAATPFIAAPPGTSTRRLLDETLAAAGHRPRLAVVTAQRDAILPLVLSRRRRCPHPRIAGHRRRKTRRRRHLARPGRRAPASPRTPARVTVPRGGALLRDGAPRLKSSRAAQRPASAGTGRADRLGRGPRG